MCAIGNSLSFSFDTKIRRLQCKNIAAQFFFFVHIQIHKLASIKILQIVQRFFPHHDALHIVRGAIGPKALIINPQAVSDFIGMSALQGNAAGRCV